MRKIIYTDHARERMFLRNISQSLVRTAIEQRSETQNEADGDIRFIKWIKRNGSDAKIHVVAKSLQDKGDETWLIKTVWIRGEDDPNFIVKGIKMFFWRIFHRKKGS